MQPPPPQPQQEAEKVETEDDNLEGWPTTPEWDHDHMQLAIEADIVSTASSVARMKQSPGPSSCLSVKQYITVATVLQSSKKFGGTPQAMASVAWGLATPWV